jgi:hypothetical protein
MMSDQTFFFKMHNRVMGPFPLARLQEMAQSGKINHAHEVSVDGSNWSKAGEHPEIFAAPAPAPVAPEAAPVQAATAAAPVAAAPVEAAPAANAPVAQAAPVEQPAEPAQPKGPPGQVDWYYATDDEPVGPVTKSEIVEYIKTGDIVRSDRVWNAQMDDWQRVGRRAEFKVAFDQMNAAVPSVSGKTSNILDLVRQVVAAKQWLIALCVLFFAGAISLLGVFFASFSDGQSLKIQKAIFSLVLAGVFAGLIVLVYQFMVKSDQFVKTKVVDDLHEAYVWLNRFWITLSVGLLISIVFLVLVITGILR